MRGTEQHGGGHLWLVQSDHMTWILASDWSRLSNTEGDSLLTRNWECWDILPVFTNPLRCPRHCILPILWVLCPGIGRDKKRWETENITWELLFGSSCPSEDHSRPLIGQTTWRPASDWLLRTQELSTFSITSHPYKTLCSWCPLLPPLSRFK